MKQTKSLLLLVVVAVVALIIGSVGTAVAGPALSKAKVKKIATKVVSAQAPTLSVASANNANNANNLNGQPASAYQDRVAQGTASTVAVNGPTTFGPTAITVPTGANFLEISVAATFYGGNTQVSLWWQLDNADCSALAGPGFANKAEGHTTTLPDNLAYTMIAPVSAGNHSVTTCATGTLVQAGGVTVLRTAQLG
jgi:hypothetical protein